MFFTKDLTKPIRINLHPECWRIYPQYGENQKEIILKVRIAQSGDEKDLIRLSARFRQPLAQVRSELLEHIEFSMTREEWSEAHLLTT